METGEHREKIWVRDRIMVKRGAVCNPKHGLGNEVTKGHQAQGSWGSFIESRNPKVSLE